MDKEYSRNQKAQEKSFKNYRKCMKKILLWSALAVISAFVIPYDGLYVALKGLLGDYLGASSTFFIQWGIVGAGFLGAAFNAINANAEKKRFNDLQAEEENIFDSLSNENDELKRKVEDLEKSKTKTVDENTRVKTIDNKTIDIQVQEVEETNVKRKKYVR